MGASSASL
jgi:hypothetical protein